MSQRTTFVIYRIWNTVNGKSYIGQTNSYKARIKRHFKELGKGTHHNRYLQSTFNKYGRDVFKFEILEGVSALEELDEREIYWITHFDAHQNGYNLTKGADYVSDAVKRPCSWNGVEYASVSEAARALDISERAMRHRLGKGYASDDDARVHQERMKSVRAKEQREKLSVPTIWNGIEYSSIKEAAQAWEVDPGTLSRWLKRGYARDNDVPMPDETRYRESVIWNGIHYPSLKIAAGALGISSTTLRYRLDMGYTSDADVKIRSVGKPIEIDGIEFKSISKAATHYGVSHNTIEKWIIEGGQSRTTRPVLPAKPVEVEGNIFPSLKKAAKFYHVSKETIRFWVETGKAKFVNSE